MLRLLRKVSCRQLRANWGRAFLVVGGIASGVALIVAVNVVNTSIVENFRRTIDLVAGPAQLEVTLGVGELGFEESVVDTVRADPDVTAAVALVRGTVSLADHPEDTLQLFGADLVAEEDLDRYQITTADRGQVLRALDDPSSILVTEQFAAERQLQVGQALRLSTPEGIRELTIRGLLRAEGLAAAFGGHLAVMDLPAARRLRVALPATLGVDHPCSGASAMSGSWDRSKPCSRG